MDNFNLFLSLFKTGGTTPFTMIVKLNLQEQREEIFDVLKKEEEFKNLFDEYQKYEETIHDLIKKQDYTEVAKLKEDPKSKERIQRLEDRLLSYVVKSCYELTKNHFFKVFEIEKLINKT